MLSNQLDAGSCRTRASGCLANWYKNAWGHTIRPQVDHLRDASRIIEGLTLLLSSNRSTWQAVSRRHTRVWSFLVAACALLVAGCGSDTGADSKNPAAAPATITATATVTATPSPPPTATVSLTPSPTASASEAEVTGAAFGPFATATSPGVSVVASGWRNDGDITHGGAVVYNNGPELFSLVVNVQASSGGSLVDSKKETVLNIPGNSFLAVELAFTDLIPGATFEIVTLEGENNDNYEAEGLNDGGVMVTAKLPAGKVGYVNVPVELTNPTSRTLPSTSVVTLLILDADNNIISSGASFTNLDVPAGQTVSDVIDSVYLPPDAVSVVASVDHADYGQ